MKKLFPWAIIALILATGFTSLRDTLWPAVSAHIQATIGRKAFLSMNSDTQGTNARYTTITKFGSNTDIDTAADETITTIGDAFTTRFGLTAETLSIVSADDADDSGSTGENSIIVGCIASDGTESTLVVTMDGTTPVLTTSTCKFVNRAAVYTSGSGDVNAGNITITQSSSGTVMAIIPTGKGTTQHLEYYVPSDRRCYMESLYLRARKLATGSARVLATVVVYSGSQDTMYDIRDFYMSTDAGGNEVQITDFKAEQVRPNEIVAFRVNTSANDLTMT